MLNLLFFCCQVYWHNWIWIQSSRGLYLAVCLQLPRPGTFSNTFSSFIVESPKAFFYFGVDCIDMRCTNLLKKIISCARLSVVNHLKNLNLVCVGPCNIRWWLWQVISIWPISLQLLRVCCGSTSSQSLVYSPMTYVLSLKDWVDC